MKKALIIFSLLIVYAFTATAQTNYDAVAKRRAAEKVAQMNDYVSFMSDKNKKLNIRSYYRKKALNLFIGKGYDYELNGVHNDGVIMEVSSTRNNTVNKHLIRNYFTNLINLKYSYVKVTCTEVADMKVSDLKLVDADKNMYTCTVQYVQIFEAGRDGVLVYKDRTTKRITCFIQKEEVPGDVEFVVQLGDTKCISTERIQ